MCQCPQRASTYFFLVDMDDGDLLYTCQCPQRASTYFFNKPYNTGGKHNEVSMPSTGFYLFLHMGLHPFLRYRRVSMPSTGFYLFLLSDDQVRANLTAKCQCPQRASTYFFSEQVFDLLSSL